MIDKIAADGLEYRQSAAATMAPGKLSCSLCLSRCADMEHEAEGSEHGRQAAQCQYETDDDGVSAAGREARQHEAPMKPMPAPTISAKLLRRPFREPRPLRPGHLPYVIKPVLNGVGDAPGPVKSDKQTDDQGKAGLIGSVYLGL